MCTQEVKNAGKILLSVFFLSLLLIGSVFAESVAIRIPYVIKGPTINAQADDPVWQDIDWHTGFVVNGSPETAADPQTRFKICHDNRRLYILVEALEPEISQLALNSDSTRDADFLIRDDNVEFFVNPGGGTDKFYQFIVNWKGAVWDALSEDDNLSGYGLRPEWNADVRSASRVEKDRWCVEFSIPFADIGLGDQKDTSGTWGINVCRNRRYSQRQFSTWSPIPQGGFRQPNYFRQVVLEKLNIAPFRWQLVTPLTEVKKKDNVLTCEVKTTLSNHTGEFRIILLKSELLAKNGMRITKEKKVALENRQEKNILLQLPLEVEGEYRLSLSLALYTQPEHILHSFLNIPVNLEFQPIRAKWIVPTYRNNIYASQNLKEAVCEIIVDPAYAGLPLSVNLHNNDSLVYERLISKSDLKQEISFSVADLPAGDYILQVSLKDLTPVKVPLQKLPYQEGEVWLDTEGTTYVNGKPFVPFGWYSMLPQAMPFVNTVHNYSPVLMISPSKGRDFLDMAHRAGLKAIIVPYQVREEYKLNWSDPLFDIRGKGRRGPFTKEHAACIRAFVEAVKDHPAILGWYMADEPEARAESQLWYRDAYRLIREIDPYHPCIMLNYSIRGIKKYYEVCDILMPDCYPAYSMNGANNKPLWETTGFVKTGLSFRPTWLVPQAYSWSYRDPSPRAPTLDELRNQIWQAFIAGGKGILLYQWLSGGRYNDAISYSAMRYGPTYLGAEIEIMKPAIIAPALTGQLKLITEPEDEHFVASLRRDGNTFFLMAANTSYEKRKASFQMNIEHPPTRMFVVGENRVVEITEGGFTDMFAPVETHLYTTDIGIAKIVDLSATHTQIKQKRAERKKNGNLVGIGELEIPEMEKLWKSKPDIITVSSTQIVYSAGNKEWLALGLLDGLPDIHIGNYFTPRINDKEPWVEVSLPKPTKIGRVQFYTLTGVADCKIMLRTPQGELRQVAEITNNKQNPVNVTFPPDEATAVRIVLTKFSQGRSVISEIEVYEN
ncbi:MAG: hypothetical protein UT30_C0021G0013 [Candidatus Uhrbacteria bacterium GW2011_GWF2_39_13]|uniref:Carbohydrate-binding domain-containing protein n=1 Tax=Candidatus Uhrbacteria bacterium GW2011_GWF2_39_13 TaxID=1618995 RepID=A0A0G0MI60_9BACT|nr:MAG: hypothetical protein UT30_C0021G0013 [Candidatus Uhrbacteria bacterium GW2011_GWF2_39_13]